MKHKPFTKKDLGKTHAFYRHPGIEEVPKERRKEVMFVNGVGMIGPLVKDNGVLVKITKTVIQDIKRETASYEYAFTTKKGAGYSSSLLMNAALNGHEVLNEKKAGKK